MRSTVLGLNGPVSFGDRTPIYLDKSGKIFNRFSTIHYRFYSYGWEDLYYLLYCGEVRVSDDSDTINVNRQIEKDTGYFIPNKNKRVLL